MHAEVFLLMIVFVGEGLLLMGVALPLIRRRIKPNPWYGFRVPKTLGDEDVWYDANAYSGRLLLSAGAVHVLTAVLFFLVPGLRNNLGAYTMACTLVLFVGIGRALLLSSRFLHSL